MTTITGQKAKMLAGELYIASDPELSSAHLHAQALLTRFNATPADAKARCSGIDYALPVSIGDGIWLGDSAIVGPGMTIAILPRSWKFPSLDKEGWREERGWFESLIL